MSHGPVPPDPLELPDSGVRLFAVLNRRWTPHLLYLLARRPARFSELQRAIPGISATSLNDRLRDLIDAGLVTRHTFPGRSLSSSYEVTPAGQLVGAHLNRMLDAILADLHG
ncbi:helix-turn-helix domain-containing protein [Actinoallomurus sp. NPDC050550]|uniref:winged helix-turn-helix transcriptional regulator n=1 Tax=Actinoallomurus sp. NPDC050550 TaxID=3154937 RepID=UPI0033C54C71